MLSNKLEYFLCIRHLGFPCLQLNLGVPGAIDYVEIISVFHLFSMELLSCCRQTADIIKVLSNPKDLSFFWRQN